MLVGLQRCIGREAARRVTLLCAAYDAVKNIDAALGIFTHAGFTTQHDAVHLLGDGIENIGDLRASRHGVFDHALQHLRGHDDLATVIGTAFDDVALDDRQVFDRALAAEIATGDHDTFGGEHDGIEIVERLLVFDFRDDACAAVLLFEDKLQVLDMRWLASKAQCEVVNTKLNTEVEVNVVLLGQWRKVHIHAREVDMTAGFHFTAGDDFREDALTIDHRRAHHDHAAIDGDGIAHPEVLGEAGIVDGRGIGSGGSRCLVGAQLDHIACLELPRRGNIASPDGRASEIHEHRDICFQRCGGLPDVVVNIARPLVGGMAHVQPEDVRTGADEGFNHGHAFRGGPEGDEDLGLSHEGEGKRVERTHGGVHGGSIRHAIGRAGVTRLFGWFS